MRVSYPSAALFPFPFLFALLDGCRMRPGVALMFTTGRGNHTLGGESLIRDAIENLLQTIKVKYASMGETITWKWSAKKMSESSSVAVEWTTM